MNALMSAAGDRMNVINSVSACTAIAQLWTTAKQSTNLVLDTSLHDELKSLYKDFAQKLQPSTTNMTAPLISNLLWSSARLDVQLDEYLPDMVRALSSRFLELTNSADVTQQPDAQLCTNLLWALAYMDHPAATRQLLATVCAHMARLTHSSDAKQHPNALDVSRMLWSLGKFEHTPADKNLLDKFCLYCIEFIGSQQECVASGHHVSTVAWALANLKHSPPEGVEAALVQRLVTLCESGRQLPPLATINFVNASAELRLNVTKEQAKILADHSLRSAARYIDYPRSAWSLAVMDLLDMAMFDSILHQVNSKHQLLEKQRGWQQTGTAARSSNTPAVSRCLLAEASQRLRPDAKLVLPELKATQANTTARQP